MSLIDFGGDPWLSEHEACKELWRDTAIKLSRRDSLTLSKAPIMRTAHATMSANLRIQLGQFVTGVRQLRDGLSVIANSGTITPDEAERRTRLVEDMETAIRGLQQRFNKNHNFDETRSQLLAEPETSTRRVRVFADKGSTGWGDDPESGTFDIARAQKMTQEVVREQDDGLEELSKIISRQKDIAQTIGNEADVQNEILDDLADGIDSTTVGLINETNQVKAIAKKSSTCGYWVVIILLFIAILISAFV